MKSKQCRIFPSPLEKINRTRTHFVFFFPPNTSTNGGHSVKGTKKIPAKPLTVDFSLFLLAEGVRGKEREKTVLYVVLLSCVWSDCCCVLLGAPFTWIPAPKLARALLKSSQSLASTRRCSGDRSGRPAVHNIPSGVYVLSLCVFILHTPRITRFSFFENSPPTPSLTCAR